MVQLSSRYGADSFAMRWGIASWIEWRRSRSASRRISGRMCIGNSVQKSGRARQG